MLEKIDTSSPARLSIALAKLEENTFQQVCKELNERDRLPPSIQTGNNLYLLINALKPPERQHNLCAALEGKVPTLLTTVDDFKLLRFFNEAQCRAIYQQVKGRIASLIEDVEDMGKIISYLPLDLSLAVCRDHDDLISSGEELGILLRHSPLEQTNTLYETFSEQTIGGRAREFGKMLAHLDPDKFVMIMRKAPSILQSPQALNNTLLSLSPQKCKAICEKIQDWMPPLIHSAATLGTVLKGLSDEQTTAICDALQPQLPSLIGSLSDLATVQSMIQRTPHGQDVLTRDQMKIIWSASKTWLLAQSNTASPLNLDGIAEKDDLDTLKQHIAHPLVDRIDHLDAHHQQLIKTIHALHHHSAALVNQGKQFKDKETQAGIAGCQLAHELKQLVLDNKGKTKTHEDNFFHEFEKKLQSSYEQMGQHRRLSFLHGCLNGIASVFSWFKKKVSQTTEIGKTSPNYFALTKRQEYITQMKNTLVNMKKAKEDATPQEQPSTQPKH